MYSKRFISDTDFQSMLNEMCSSCTSELNAGGGDGLEMLMGNLAKIHEYSGEMMAMLSRDPEVEDWIEDKISKAAQSLEDAKHYIEYKKSAYGSQAQAIGAHGGDLSMDQRQSVGGGMERIQGDRMSVMSQYPEMTPQSRAVDSGGCGGGEGLEDFGGGEEMEDLPHDDFDTEAPEEEEGEMSLMDVLVSDDGGDEEMGEEAY